MIGHLVNLVWGKKVQNWFGFGDRLPGYTEFLVMPGHAQEHMGYVSFDLPTWQPRQEQLPAGPGHLFQQTRRLSDL